MIPWPLDALEGWPSKRGNFVHKYVDASDLWPGERGGLSREWPFHRGTTVLLRKFVI